MCVLTGSWFVEAATPSEIVRPELTRVVVSVPPTSVVERFSESSIRIALYKFTCLFLVYLAIMSVCGMYIIHGR